MQVFLYISPVGLLAEMYNFALNAKCDMLYRLHFKIEYKTEPNCYVAVKFIRAHDGANGLLRLSSSDHALWTGHFELQLSPNTIYEYYYLVERERHEIVCEKIYPPRQLKLDRQSGEHSFRDVWRYDIKQMNYGSSAIAGCLFPAPTSHNIAKKGDEVLTFKTYALTPHKGEFKIMLTGNSDALGYWNPNNGITLKRCGNYEYSVNTRALPYGTQYKYVVIYNGKVYWESGENRIADAVPHMYNATFNDGWLRIPQFTDWRGAGILVPLFSLHSNSSEGIGDFNDLKSFVSWAAKAGLSVVQILPINDTNTFGTWRDSYPYNIMSAYALNPVYINIKKAGGNVPLALRNKLNAKESVDYEKTFKLKVNALHALYDKKRHSLKQDASYAKFVSENAFWLDPYAEFCTLRDKYGSLDFNSWKGHEQYNSDSAAGKQTDFHCDEITEKAGFYKFVQYIAFSQMSAVKKHARRLGIILKGDVPIGVNLCSAEVWQRPELFKKDMSTGAPPDYFSEDGQNWGFPTYNWKNMSRDSYSWWKSRLKVMSQFFDAFRIDHVLGFFRIWEIPRKYSSAKYGHFSPAIPYSRDEIFNKGFKLQPNHIGSIFLPDVIDPSKLHPAVDASRCDEYKNLSPEQKNIFNNIHDEFFGSRNEKLWERTALERLSVVTDATSMLPCAEDLGMLPKCAEPVLEKMDILSLEIQSMPKQPWVEYDDVMKYPYRSVAMLTTHDMPSFRLWWKKFPDRASRYAKNVLGMKGDVPAEATPEICTKVVENQLMSPSMICILSFQDWTGISSSARSHTPDAEQVNDPANSKQYWRYRTHLSLEQLEGNEAFTAKVHQLICASHRDLL